MSKDRLSKIEECLENAVCALSSIDLDNPGHKEEGDTEPTSVISLDNAMDEVCAALAYVKAMQGKPEKYNPRIDERLDAVAAKAYRAFKAAEKALGDRFGFYLASERAVTDAAFQSDPGAVMELARLDMDAEFAVGNHGAYVDQAV